MTRWLMAVLAVGLAHDGAAAQAAAYLREHYTKQEVRIPMRDGAQLFTSIYVPKDASRAHPVLLRRTPYSCAPYGPDAFPGGGLGNQMERYARAGYILVCQDVRGRYLSEGDYVNVRPVVTGGAGGIDETTDTYDTVEWLVKNLTTSNGRVGIYGISYPGFYAWMGTINAHPAVVATSPQAPVSKWMDGDDFYHNGALLLSHAFDFYAGFGAVRPAPTAERGSRFDHGTPDGYTFFLRMGPLANANAAYFHGERPFWDTLTVNDQWNDFWAARNVLPHLRDLKPATLVVGGWFDTENLFGALNSYAANEAGSPGATNYLVMGPWYHGEWNGGDGEQLGAIAWGTSTSRYYIDSIEGPFFDHYLMDGPAPHLAEATVFNTGSKRWARFDAWPPRSVATRRLVLGADGALRMAASPASSAAPAFDEYVHDPAKPVPHTAKITHWYDREFMLEDQRFAGRRPDVLVYRTEPLTEDVTIAGPIRVRFTVSTTGTDADWVVKLIDVFPDDEGGPTTRSRGDDRPRLGGYEMLVRGDVLRGKFRNGLDRPEPFTPGEPTALAFTLQDAFHTFRAGHRIMIQVQSSWFPMVDRNPGVFMHLIDARPEDFRKTTQRVYRSAERPSFVEVQVLR